jgi:hypothetical protein
METPPEIADKFRLQRIIKIVRAAAAWEDEAQLLSRQAYDTLLQGLAALAAAVDLLTPALPDELHPMTEMADTFHLQHAIVVLRAAADWEREAQLLSRAEYEALQVGLSALAAAIDRRTPELPDDLQP